MKPKIVQHYGHSIIEPPDSLAEFRVLLRAARSKTVREALIDGVEWSYDGTVHPKDGTRVVRAVDKEVLRGMMLELVATPKLYQSRRNWEARVQTYQWDVWRRLVETWDVDCERVLRRWLASRNTAVLRQAGEVAALSGSQRLLPVVRRFAHHKNLKVRASIFDGVKFCSRHSTKRHIAEMLSLAMPYVEGRVRIRASEDAWSVAYEAVAVPRHLVPNRAWAILTSPRVLHPDNPAVSCVLWDLHGYAGEFPAKTRRPIPAEVLWPLFEAARAGTFPALRKGEGDRVLGLVLVLASATDPTRVNTEAKRILKEKGTKEWSELTDFARKALRACKGVPQLDAVVARFDKNERRFTGDALLVLRAHECAREVVTDGLSLYFHNLGQHWQAARRGLLVLGQKRAASVLERGAKLVFGGTARRVAGSADAARACEAMSDSQRSRLERLDDQAQSCTGGVFAAVQKYVGTHPTAFK